MDDNVATDSTTAVPPVVTPAAPSVPQGENWEKRFKGLDAAYQKLQRQFAALTEERDRLLEEREVLTSSENTLKSQLTKVQGDLQSTATEKDGLSGQLTTLQAEKERIRLIMSEFSDLSSFEAKGLLPAGSNLDDLRSKFTEFRDALSSTVESSMRRKAVGAGPTPTGGGGAQPELTKEQIYAELTRLAGARSPEDRRRYDELVAAWDKLNTGG